jgi:hypothetical protein
MLMQRMDGRKVNGGVRRGFLCVVCGLLCLAVLATMRMQARADEKAEPAKPKAKADQPQRPEAPGKAALEEMLKRLPPGMDAERVKEMRKRMEEMARRMDGGRFPAFPGMPDMGRGFGLGAMKPGRLGVAIEVPSATLVDQLDLPKGKGIVIRDVSPNSAAAKAGIKAHDILLELDGKSVSSKVDEFVHQVDSIKAGKKLDALVLRKGKKETVKGLMLAEVKVEKKRPGRIDAFDPFGNLPNFPGAGALKGEGKADMISTVRSGDKFTTTKREGDFGITVSGTIEAGKAKVTKVEVRKGETTKAFDGLDKVPEVLRKKVNSLVEMSEKGAVRANSKEE